MLREKIRYAAAETKVHAMYGKLISGEEWKRLYECGSLGEMLNILRGQKSWGGSFQGLSAIPDAQELRPLAKKKVFGEYEKLYRFLDPGDKGFIRIYLAGVEYSAIMSKLRSLHAKTPSDMSACVTDFLRSRCSIDIAAMERAENYGQLLQAAERSIFYGELKALPIVQETGLPRHRDAGIALENRYYSSVFAYVIKNCSGHDKKTLTELLGTKADFLNLVSILRLKRYFPASLEGGQELLIPVSYRLRPALIRGMLEAKNEEELMKLIALSPFAGQFAEGYEGDLDNLYEGAVCSVCRRLIRMPVPGLATIIAYMILSEMESLRLQGLIEAAGYGIRLEKK